MSKKNPDATILDYLQQQNRPYSAVDIFTNLHKEIGKTAVVKCLEALAEQKKIVEKIYGKQKVYAPLQDRFGDFKEADLKDLDVKIKETEGRVSSLQKEAKGQEAELNLLSRQLTSEEAARMIKELKVKVGTTKQKISKLQSGTVLVTKDQKEKIYQRRDKLITHWKKRKRMAVDMLGCILEGYPKTKKQLYEDIGIETDEENGVQVPNLK